MLSFCHSQQKHCKLRQNKCWSKQRWSKWGEPSSANDDDDDSDDDDDDDDGDEQNVQMAQGWWCKGQPSEPDWPSAIQGASGQERSCKQSDDDDEDEEEEEEKVETIFANNICDWLKRHQLDMEMAKS